MRSPHAGWLVRTHARLGRAAGPGLWYRLWAGIPGVAHPTGGLRDRRRGGIIHWRRTRAAHRPGAGDGDDGQRDDAVADAGSMLCRDAGANASRRPANLRFPEGATRRFEVSRMRTA